MNQSWVNQDKTKIVCSYFLNAVFLSQILLLVYHGLHTIYGYDFFWHLRIGLDLLEKSWWPSVDRYSIDHYGQAYSYPMPVPFQFLIAVIYKIANLELTVASVLIMFGLAPLLLVKKIYQKGVANSYVMASAWIVLTSAFLLRGLPRPEIVSYLYLAIELILIKMILQQSELKSIKITYLLGLIFVQWIWVNTHFSSVVGYVVLFGIFSELTIKTLLIKDFKRFFIYSSLGLLALLLGFLNPGLHHPVLAAFNFSNEWKHMVGEYFQPKMYGEEHYFAFVLSFLSLTLFLKSKSIAYVLINLVLLIQTLQMPKLFSVQIFVNVLCLLNYISVRSIKIPLKLSVLILVSIIAFQVSLISRKINKTFWSGNYKMALPYELSNYFVKSNLKPGNVFNDYEHGGYLLYRLADKLKVFIDGRTNILYPPQQMKDEFYSKIHPRLMYEIVNEKKMDYLITSLKKADNAFEIGLRTGLFNLEYADKFHVLLNREEKKYPKTEMLFVYPRCLHENDIKSIESEFETLTQNLPEGATPLRLLKLAKDYLKESDKEVFLHRSKMPQEATAYDLRLLAVLNYNEGKWFNSLMYFDWIDKNFELSRRDKLLILKILKDQKLSDQKKANQSQPNQSQPNESQTDLTLKEVTSSVVKYIQFLGHNYQYLNDIDFLIFIEILEAFKDVEEAEIDKILQKPKLAKRYEFLKFKNYSNDDLYKENCIGSSELKWKSDGK